MARLHRQTWDFWRPRWIKSLPYLILLYAVLWSSRVTSMCSLMPVVQLPSWCYLGRRSGTPRRLRPKLQRRQRWHYSNLPGWYVLLLTLTHVGRPMWTPPHVQDTYTQLHTSPSHVPPVPSIEHWKRDQYRPVTGGNFRKCLPTCKRYASVLCLEVFEIPRKDARKFWQPDRVPKRNQYR